MKSGYTLWELLAMACFFAIGLLLLGIFIKLFRFVWGF